MVRGLFVNRKNSECLSPQCVQKTENLKQTLINNGFPNYIVHIEMKQFIYKSEQPNIDNNLNHKNQ